jgi:redox-sensitive bicupin YhaK (pirin superfamily)
MDSVRKVKLMRPGVVTLEGAGVQLRRMFGFQQIAGLDPFLMLDDFSSDDPRDYMAGFPWHPHRGIETVTYLLKGEIAHGDSMGNRGTIGPGEVQWMTAGSGVIHQEMPHESRDGLQGFQLWVNLPAAEKMTPPRYRGIVAKEIPLVETRQGARVRVVCGEVAGTRGPVREIRVDPEYLDIDLPGGAVFSHPVRRGYNAFAYLFRGQGRFAPGGEAEAGAGSLIVFHDGDGLEISAGPGGARLLLVSGKPLREPVAWRGPIVMNTPDELRLAFAEYEAGTFLKHQAMLD